MKRPKKTLDTRRVQCFHQIVESGSIRAAAEVLDMDPSAVSRAVSLLEEELGMQLLSRQGRGVVPTDLGRLLATYASRQMDVLESFYEQAAELHDAQRGHIDIVMGEGMLDGYFHPIVTDFMRDHPRLTVNLMVTNTDEGVEKLVTDLAHIGILYHAPKDVRLRSHRANTALPIQTIVRRDHPLTALDRPLKLHDLLDYAGATVHEDFGLRQFITAAEISERVRLNHVMTTTSFRALWQFVNAGLGYTLCGGTFATWINMPDIVALPMANPILNRCSVQIVTRHGRHLSPAATSLLQHVLARLAPGA